MAERILGIDLGTTSSCVALAEGKNIKVLPNAQGYHLTPSIVGVNPKQRLLVGSLAKRQAVTNPSGTVLAFKRLMGRRFDSVEVSRVRSRVPYPIVPGRENDAQVELHGKVLNPVEIAAYILSEVTKVAEEHLGEKARKVIITVPANYNEVQRQATVTAAEILGLEVVRLLNEPTAAALAYGLGHNDRRRNIIVYDLGGGTFDVTALGIENDVYEVLSTYGDTFLGGEDFDNLILSDWLNDILENHNLDLSQDRMALARLKDAAEQVKIALSGSPDSSVELPFLSERDGQPFHYTGRCTQARFDELAEPLVAGTLKVCEEAMKRAKLKVEDIDDVVLIGGMTRMPAVQSAVQDFFGRAPAKGIHPEEAVACGAALLGAGLGEGGAKHLLMDVVPQTLSIATGEHATPLIAYGSKLPAKTTKRFSTSQDNQRSVRVRVVQGENKKASENTLVGVFEVTDLPPRPRGEVSIDVSFHVTPDGLLEVSAQETTSGQKKEVRLSEALRNAALTLSLEQKEPA